MDKIWKKVKEAMLLQEEEEGKKPEGSMGEEKLRKAIMTALKDGGPQGGKTASLAARRSRRKEGRHTK